MAGGTGQSYRRGSASYRGRARQRRKERMIRLIILFGTLILIVIAVVFLFMKIFSKNDPVSAQSAANQSVSDKTASNDLLTTKSITTKVVLEKPLIDVQLLTINYYSRPAIAVQDINNIVIHYVGNAGTTAQENRDYFERLKDTGERSASSHFVVGLEGEIIQCIPTTEIAYAANSRNQDTLSIEVCHPDETGEFTDTTYDTLIELVAWLCGEFDLTADDIIRHSDVYETICPKYYTEHEDAWEQLKEDVAAYIEQYGTDVTKTITDTQDTD